MQVRSYLIELARSRRLITSQDLSNQCNLGLVMQESEFARAEIGRILGEISTFEHNAGRPLLSVLVVTKGDNYQGDGFYKLCEQLGFGPWRQLKSDITFEVGHMNRCYDFWGNEANYSRYR